MTGTLLEFPSFRTAADAARRTELQETERRVLVRSIREAASNPSRKFEGDDVIWVARGVHRLLTDAKASKIKQQKILDAVGRESKLHLERFYMDHKLSPAEVKKQGTKKLNKKIADYVMLIEGVAKLLGREPDEVLAETFADTRFFQEAVNSVDDPAVELKFLINQMITAVIRAEDLSSYFKLAREIPAMFDPVRQDFLASKKPVLTDSGSLEASAEYSWHRPGLPGVALARLERHHFSGPLTIEAKLLAPSSADVSEAARLASPVLASLTHVAGAIKPPTPFSQQFSRPAEITLYTEIRLVIGPVVRRDLGPIIELGTYVDLAVGGRKAELTFPYSLSMLAVPSEDSGEIASWAGSVAAKLEDGWHRVTGVGGPGWDALLEIAPGFGLHLDTGLCLDPVLREQPMHEFPVYWEKLDTRLVRKLLVLFSTPRGLRVLVPDKGPYPEPVEYRFWGCPALERGLHTGSIEQAMRASCVLMRDKLEKRAAEYKQKCARMTDDLIQRWRRL
jgi:hypothetical protein